MASTPWDLQQALRDLQWCAQSPLLLRQASAVQRAQLPALDDRQLAEPLARHLAQCPASRRLGHYFEYLWQFLVQLAGERLVAADRQIGDGQSTLGALDLLSYHPGHHRYCHTELAVKFYLALGDGSQLQHWLGPDRRDRLDLKLARLRSHQLPLSQRPEGRLAIARWCAELGLPAPARCAFARQLLMQGYLFRPAAEAGAALHPWINPEHGTGLWFHASAFAQWLAEAGPADSRWVQLPRLAWLSRAELAPGDDRLLTPAQLRAALRPAPPRALLLARLEATEAGLRECQRVMLVPDHWPQTC